MSHTAGKVRPSIRNLFVSAAAVLTVSVITTAAGSQDTVAQKDVAPTVPLGALSTEEQEAFAVRAEELAYKVCDECHALDEVTFVRRSSRNWRDMVTTMATKGAIATKDQFAIVTLYLTRYHGIVGVNSAPAEELSAVLGLTPKEAETVVEFRKANGKFANLDALTKVPGVDKAKLEEQPDALKFD